MTSCKSNKTTDTQNNTTDSLGILSGENVFNSIDDFYKVKDQYLNKEVTILNCYTDSSGLSSELNDNSYSILSYGVNSNYSIVSVVNKDSYDKFGLNQLHRKMISSNNNEGYDLVYGISSDVLIDTWNSCEYKYEYNDIDISSRVKDLLMVYDKSKGYLDSVYGDNDFNNHWGFSLTDIDNSIGWDDLRKGRFKLMSFNELKKITGIDDINGILTFYPYKISIKGTYIGKVSIDTYNNYGQKITLVSSEKLTNVQILKVEEVPIPKEFSTPGKSIDINNFLSVHGLKKD